MKRPPAVCRVPAPRARTVTLSLPSLESGTARSKATALDRPHCLGRPAGSIAACSARASEIAAAGRLIPLAARLSRPCRAQFLQYGLAILATHRKRVGGAIRYEGIAVIDHQFKRGSYLSVLAIIQSDGAAGHGILPLLRTKIPPPSRIVASIGQLAEGVFRSRRRRALA
jgi:hypothetical protein